MPKKADIIILISCLTAGLLCFFIWHITSSNSNKTVVISQNNNVIYQEKLSKDNRIELHGNTIVIKDGYVNMESADCKNQICVHHKKISKKGETIVCLPNKVLVEIK